MTTIQANPADASDRQWRPDKGRFGILCFILSECAFFLTLIIAFIFYIGKSQHGPMNFQVLDHGLVWINTIALLSSSATVVIAVKQLEKGRLGLFKLWLFLTICLGVWFIIGTGIEWYGLIYGDGLTIRTNLFGTTFYTLVGFHAFHVCLGLTCLSTVLVLSLAGKVNSNLAQNVDILSWYWHFVDTVWIVVLVVVYYVGFYGSMQIAEETGRIQQEQKTAMVQEQN